MASLKAISSSATLSREYWVVRNRYSQLLFTYFDRLCANLRVQRAIDKYDVTMPVARVRVTSQINYGDITMISQKKVVLGDNGEIDDQ